MHATHVGAGSPYPDMPNDEKMVIYSCMHS
jgi:hypothetical protein